MHEPYLYSTIRIDFVFMETRTFEDKDGKFLVKMFTLKENFQDFEQLHKGIKTKDRVFWGIKTCNNIA